MLVKVDYLNTNHINYIKQFASLCDISFFKYFKKRSVDDAVQNHIHTLLELENDTVKGYGHIDLNKELGKYFLGLCVLPNYQNQGIGTNLLNTLLNYADEKKLTLYLSVDNENHIAKKMYLNAGFHLLESKETYQIYIREPK